MFNTNVFNKATISSTKKVQAYIRFPEELLKVDDTIITTGSKLIKNTVLNYHNTFNIWKKYKINHDIKLSILHHIRLIKILSSTCKTCILEKNKLTEANKKNNLKKRYMSYLQSVWIFKNFVSKLKYLLICML